MSTKSYLEMFTNKLCLYCGKPGHKFSECRLRKKNGQEKNEKANLAKSSERSPGYNDELGVVCREVTNSESNGKMPQSKSSGGVSKIQPLCASTGVIIRRSRAIQ